MDLLRRTPAALASAFLLLALPGCGSEEKLYRVSGAVTHGGAPVQKGLIFFDPTVDGPQGFANIENGKYDTAVEGKGVRGGSYHVRVNGFDGKKVPDLPFGHALFPEYNAAADLPQADSTFDLNIPKNR
jgi:hypothetical protein